MKSATILMPPSTGLSGILLCIESHCMSVPKIVLILEMVLTQMRCHHSLEFHLGLKCLSKYSFEGLIVSIQERVFISGMFIFLKESQYISRNINDKFSTTHFLCCLFLFFFCLFFSWKN